MSRWRDFFTSLFSTFSTVNHMSRFNLSLSSHVMLQRYVFSRRSVENDRSLEAVVTGSVTRITRNVVWLHATSTSLVFFGTASWTRLYHRHNSPTADSSQQCSTSAHNLYSCRRSCSSASVGSSVDAFGMRHLWNLAVVSCDLPDAPLATVRSCWWTECTQLLRRSDRILFLCVWWLFVFLLSCSHTQ